MDDPYQPPALDPQSMPVRRTLGQRLRQLFGPVLVALAAAGKFVLPFLKFALPFGKVALMMLVSFGFYAMAYGWRFAIGVIILLLIHESGHLIAARYVGLKVGLPVFIPFMGAVIALREAPRNAWIEAVVGIGGPILGSIGAAAVAALYFPTGYPLFLLLGYAGFFLNLFNLIPIVPLDGGRIVSAVSPWLWIVGLCIMVPYLIFIVRGAFAIVLMFIIAGSLPRVFALFGRRDKAAMRYFECTPTQRVLMGVLYFSLVGSLFIGMHMIHEVLPLRNH